ncbi:Peroxidase 2 [Capsicum chinense]|uniref:Peroxidase n=1 Tax=Capsicum annuum TaxID=4072 RepID=A0A2G2YKW4_CAPAN|nr:cationic peroxidase 1 [Capsicum annuum]KAF3643250.1 Peroxidase 2 [Capsicum annuum]KAF3650115.1 Peroxidase 2 [Capsicum annuum]PHT70241.1 Peroxidase 2 [Capsicum annuum]PHU04825.1 Peroxidase 2 [Capsicum chinense]
MASHSFLFLYMLVTLSLVGMAFSDLDDDFYDDVCPKALPTIKRVVEDAVRKEKRMGASLLRLHFHDCFVNGCDASILLDQTSAIDSEKTSRANNNSARGFEVIDKIKSEVDKVCGRSVVSCADILAVAARDSVVALHGPSWEVKLGRRDSTTASRTAADNNIPTPLMDLPALISNFKNHGLDEEDLVALSGGHTLGFAQCFTFRNRIYNETNINSTFARQLQANCPRSGGDSNLATLDPTAAIFDSKYFSNLVSKKGLLHSDQALVSGGKTGGFVKEYSKNLRTFSKDFAKSMIKMGDIKPLTGKQGQIRVNCRKVN